MRTTYSRLNKKKTDQYFLAQLSKRRIALSKKHHIYD